MRLVTDYVQYYDSLFDGSGPTFHRMAFTRGGLSKRLQFDLFNRLGLQTPPHGLVQDLVRAPRLTDWLGATPEAWREEVHCIVYEDEYAHAGAGKLRLSLAEAQRRYPTRYASLYLPPAERAVNLRHVRLGRVGIWLRQATDTEDWRSNRRDAETVLSCRREAGPPPIPRVLWAIDFLPTPWGLLAIDFNTAPELSTLGETHTLEPAEIAAELDHAASRHPEHLRQFEELD